MNGTAILSITRIPPNVVVSWINGYPPFILQKRDSLTIGTWQNVSTPTMVRNKMISSSGTMGFFRVMEAVPLLDADLSQPNQTRLFWTIPELS